MKMITAIIDPDKLDGVRDSLQKTGEKYMLVTAAKASAVEGGFTERYRGSTYITEYYDFTRVEVVVDDAKLDTVITAILNATEGEKGIGRIFTSTIDSAINIGTGKTSTEEVA